MVIRNNLEQKKLIIYGAGVVGRNVLEQIHIQNPDKNIDAIMVSKKDNDWQQIDGISVVEAGNFDKAIKDDYVVCIATTPKYHDEIKQSLVNNGFEHYYLLGETN